MKAATHHSERRANYARENCTTERGSNQQLKELVRGSVEVTLNGLLEAESEKLMQAGRYERNEHRQGYRSGHYRCFRVYPKFCVNSKAGEKLKWIEAAGRVPCSPPWLLCDRNSAACQGQRRSRCSFTLDGQGISVTPASCRHNRSPIGHE